MKPKKSHDAIGWYVLNDSGGLEKAANWPLWDAWRHAPGNKEKYIATLDFVELLRTLSPPGIVRGEELVRDAEADPEEDDDGSRPH